MSRVILDISDESDLQLLLAFASKLKATVVSLSDNIGNTKKGAMWWMEQLAQQGGTTSISNPSEWQREIRKDKPQPTRD
jgi:hypothetical protein